MGRRARILAVDDEPGALEVLTELLTWEGYEVFTAQDTGAACMLLTVALPDVVLLDIWMAGTGGLSILRRICARHPGLPVIMVTGHTDDPSWSVQP